MLLDVVLSENYLIALIIFIFIALPIVVITIIKHQSLKLKVSIYQKEIEDFMFNPKDVKFIGSPIDLIVFQGLQEGLNRVSIHFIEVKTGSSKLSETQIKIKSAVEDKRVFWEEINPANL